MCDLSIADRLRGGEGRSADMLQCVTPCSTLQHARTPCNPGVQRPQPAYIQIHHETPHDVRKDQKSKHKNVFALVLWVYPTLHLKSRGRVSNDQVIFEFYSYSNVSIAPKKAFPALLSAKLKMHFIFYPTFFFEGRPPGPLNVFLHIS